MSRTAKTSSGLILGLLLVAYTLNFLDRQIVSILKIPIKAELGLSDTQLGLMGGIAFASVYSTLAIPFARYADRKGRGRVIVLAVATWSLFTALCGLVTSFWQLFLARMGVGVGEAGGVAPSYALIAQHVAPERRARAMAIFFLGIPSRVPRHRRCRATGRLADRAFRATRDVRPGDGNCTLSPGPGRARGQAELLASLARRRIGFDLRLRLRLLAAVLFQ